MQRKPPPISRPPVPGESTSSWYSGAAAYWEQQPSTVDGVLGGFSRLSGTDIAGSRRFLETLYQRHPELSSSSVLDCGGGIGRVSKSLLLPFGFAHVDVLEPSPNLLHQAQVDLGSAVRSYLPLPLQDWTPPSQSYSVIWAQWVLLYLPDEHLVRFFRRAVRALAAPGAAPGVLVLKENVSSSAEAVLDLDDNSVTRTVADYRRLAELAGLEVLLEMKQPMWPTDLYPVVMLGLRAREAADSNGQGEGDCDL